MFKLFDKLIFLPSIIAMIGLLGAYISSYVSPNTFAFPSLLGLAYPFLLISNIILLFYWIIRWHKMTWAVLIVTLLGLPTFSTYYGTNKNQEHKQDADISLLSYNVRYFDIYNWSEQKDTKKDLLKYLANFSGNIICLQEFALKEHTKEEKQIIQELKSFSHHYIYKDMAIFSRLPIINKGGIPFEDKYSSTCMYCDIKIAQDTFRLYNVHLESYKFSKKERQFMKEISQGVTSNNLSGSTKHLIGRLTTANKSRANQAALIKKHTEQSPHKFIICGDFNDTPLSYTYKTIKKGLQDSFIKKGRGIGNTYIGEFPSFRIDYILHTTDFETTNYTKDPILLSDHYPIWGEFRIKN